MDMNNILSLNVSSICNCEYLKDFIVNSTFEYGCTDKEFVFRSNLIIVDGLSENDIHRNKFCARYLQNSSLILNGKEYRADCSEINQNEKGALECNTSKIDTVTHQTGPEAVTVIAIVFGAIIFSLVAIGVVLAICWFRRRQVIGPR